MTNKIKLLKSISIIGVVIIYSIVSVFYIAPWSKTQILFSSYNKFINGILMYQLITLIIMVLFLLYIFIIKKQTFKIYFKSGNGQNNVLSEPLIGLKPNQSEKWGEVGRNFAIIITGVTIIIIYLGGIKDQVIDFHLMIKYIPLIFIFSLSNAFVEEMIYRLGIVVALNDIISDKKIALSSGVIFGCIHYFGNPGGILGIIFAGFLGWFLAKSIIETKGVFWAYFIHFLQDFVIFSSILLFF